MHDRDKSRPIGVFDSGIGGLTVLHALRDRLPGEDLIYLGDTARLPYGTKSADSVTRYAVRASQRLVDEGIKLLVVACNTASAVALTAIADAFPGLPVIGVLEPGAAAASKSSRGGDIVVLATERTVAEGAYKRAIVAMRPDANVISLACPLLVGMAEEGWIEGPLAESIVERYLAPVHDRPHDTLLLGCTHFPILAPVIARVAGPEVDVVDSAATTADAVADMLAEEQEGDGNRIGTSRYLATDSVTRFARIGGMFLGEPLSPDDIELVDL